MGTPSSKLLQQIPENYKLACMKSKKIQHVPMNSKQFQLAWQEGPNNGNPERSGT